MGKWMPMSDADLAEQSYRFATENYAKEGFVPEAALRGMVETNGAKQSRRRQNGRGHAADGLL